MDDNNDLINETNKVLEDTYLRITRIEPLLRRFAMAMQDLGAPVPTGWASQIDPDVVDFGSLTRKQFDLLVCLVEDIARNRPVEVTIVRGGPSLFDPGAPAGPVAPPIGSSVHMVVPR
ncbi:unannotated protein [freshwater metagenome]|uniref:Unannotated protein n=1 Tax=freshwater metagenome TaxID=449393 RepID=A0A6J7F1B1_9ZZZZ|nr:hypothetical protein [Actinomycetota bacterium]